MKYLSKKLLSIILVLMYVVTSLTTVATTVQPKEMKVHFIDVGQADCSLIQMPNGKNILIDAGNNEDYKVISQYLKDRNIKKLDAVIGTHPHEDHIGAMDDIIKNFEIGSVYMPKVTHTSKTFEDVLTAIKNRGLKVQTAKAGTEIKLDDAVTIKMLSPNGEKYEDLNDYSPILKVTYNKNSFLFTGDAETVVEQEVLNKKLDVKADVLKVGHHGSDSSSSDAFIKAVSPKYSVISVGVDNSYKHPTKTVLDTIKKYNSEIFRTDTDGTVIAVSDGQKVTMTKKGKVQQPNAPPTTTKPATTAKPTTPTTTPTGTTVYITETGSKYHKDGCRHLKSKIKSTLEQAKAKGLTACGTCKP